MDFYEEVNNLYTRVKHGAISSDDFAFQVGVLLAKYAAQHSVHRTGCTCPLIDENTMGINPDCVVHGKLASL